jgi:hypothetical protein
MRTLICFLAGLLAAWSSAALAAADWRVTDPRCEYGTDPLGVDVPAPRLSWKLESQTQGQKQTACQILVASSRTLLDQNRGDLWDSGKRRTDQNLLVPYAGKALRSSQQVFWKVRAWDKDGKPSDWSAAASWTTGILDPADWKAHWIGGSTNPRPPLFIGYHSATTPQSNEIKWVQVDLRVARPLSEIRLHPVARHGNRTGFGFPLRFKIEASLQSDFAHPVLLHDQTAADLPNPGANPVVVPVHNLQARFVRVTATSLWKRDELYCCAFSELEVFSSGQNVARGAKVSAKDSVEDYGWGKIGLTDGFLSREEAPPGPQTLMLRREFTVKPGLRRAVIHLCGLGCYELSVNGAKVGPALFPPGWTRYDKTCLYDTYDLTPHLREGPNAAGLLLGNGMYNVVGGRYTKFKGSFGPLKATGQLVIEYADGTTDLLVTDPQWKLAPGPITFSCVFGGEDYDARLELAGWSKPGFDDSAWKAALTVPGPGGVLRGYSCAAPPITAHETLPVRATNRISSSIAVYDLGQNASLMPRLRVRGSAGSSVKIIPAELVDAKGLADRSSCGGGVAYWKYTLAGTGSETWFPRFFYHGARYLQVECEAPEGAELPTVESIEGIVVHAHAEAVGDFECSNELFNRIRRLVRWAQRSNMMSVMTDCPHREKLGWLEEDHLNGPALRYEFDLSRVFTKILNDMADSQLADGLVPDIAPEYVQFNGGFRDSPEWGSACILVPWQQYLFNGDVDLLRRYFPVMEAYVAYLGSRATNHIVSHGLGDWYDIGPNPPGYAQLTPSALTATAFYYYDTWILSQAAKRLAKPREARGYRDLAQAIARSFNHAFFHPADPNAAPGSPALPRYATGSQCANSIPLVMDLVPPTARPGVLESVVSDVRSRGNALTAGDVGYRYLLRALADGGRSDVIYDMNNQSDKPGYGYQLKQGATSLTEAWDARRQSSHNHFMLGQITEWFYHDLAGIQPDPASPGFKKIIIRPAVVGDLNWVRASYRSLHGPIVSHWRRDGRNLSLSVTLPPNTTAMVVVPAAPNAPVTETLHSSTPLKPLRRDSRSATFQVPSGQYEFRSTL